MRRREFIAGLLLAAETAVAGAQPTARVYRIAIVTASATVADISETGSNPFWGAFFKELRRLGHIEGQDLLVERYTGAGRPEDYFEELTSDPALQAALAN